MHKIIGVVVIVVLSIIASAAGVLFFVVHNHIIDFSILEHYDLSRPSIVLDDEGIELTRFQRDRREPVELNQVPRHLIQAFLAIEDHDFWSHCGVSLKAICRSLLINCYNGKFVQGASTITQQLVKLLYFDSRKNITRKLKEQFLSLLLERQFSKEHILQTYLNHVYFGCGIYGVEAACQRFWGKHVTEISLDQAAVLAGIVRSPARYCPLLFPLSSEKRRNRVLHAMLNIRYISQEAYQQAIQQPLAVIKERSKSFAAHAKEYIRIFLENIFEKEQLYGGGLIIQTTLNKKIQEHAEREFTQHITSVREKLYLDVDGALICMHVHSGAIKALVGGMHFEQSQFNRALLAKRQLGSIFKPLIYAAALKKGKSFADTEVDEPIVFDHNGRVWQPQNHSRTFEGLMTLAYALSISNNIVAIKTLIEIGLDAVIELAKKCRIQGPLLHYPSLALGCVDGTLKEAVGMFNVFANNGVYVEPHMITWVKDQWGRKIWKKKIDVEKVLEPTICGQVTKVLSIGMDLMKSRNKQSWIDVDCIGKTGTTNDCRTCWFCGATPEYVTGLCIGCDDNTSMGEHAYASGIAFPIWLELNKHLSHSTKSFFYDPSLKEIYIDSRTGQHYANRINNKIFSILVPRNYESRR